MIFVSTQINSRIVISGQRRIHYFRNCGIYNWSIEQSKLGMVKLPCSVLSQISFFHSLGASWTVPSAFLLHSSIYKKVQSVQVQFKSPIAYPIYCTSPLLLVTPQARLGELGVEMKQSSPKTSISPLFSLLWFFLLQLVEWGGMIKSKKERERKCFFT